MTCSDASATYTLSHSEAQITRAVDRIIATHRALDRSFARHKPLRRVRTERRQSERVELNVPVELTSVLLQDGVLTCVGEMTLGITRDIGTRGVGLSLDHPLNSTLVLAEFDVCRDRPIRLLFRRRWQRHVATFSYATGGEFVGLLLEESPRSRLDRFGDIPSHVD